MSLITSGHFYLGESGHYYFGLTVAIEGVVPPDSALCYQITTAAGQTADIAISGVNMMFSIEGVTDAQDKYRFTTEQKTYRITVSQLMRSVTNEPFTLTIAIE